MGNYDKPHPTSGGEARDADRDLPLSRVAELNRLTWDRVGRMEMSYIFRLEARHPPPESIRAIGIDEISVAKGQIYAIVGADLDQKRPIWISREPGRTQLDLDMLFVDMGTQRCASIRLAVMDMWNPFLKSTKAQAPNAQIVYDKFHVMTYLGDALDDVRRLEFQNAHAEDRRLIKGQRYTLLSRRANLDEKKERALALLLKANRRRRALLNYGTARTPGRRGTFSAAGAGSYGGDGWNSSRNSPTWGNDTGTASCPTAVRRTESPCVSWRA